MALSASGLSARRSLALENKLSLNRVMIFEVDVLPQGRVLHPELGRPGDVGWRARNRRKYGIAERCHLAVGTAKRLHLAVRDAADAQGSPAFGNFEGDRRMLYGNHLADELYEVSDGAALFAGVDRNQRLFLGLGGALVDVHHHAPVALQDVAGNMRGESHRKARHIDAVDLA